MWKSVHTSVHKCMCGHTHIQNLTTEPFKITFVIFRAKKKKKATADDKCIYNTGLPYQNYSLPFHSLSKSFLQRQLFIYSFQLAEKS